MRLQVHRHAVEPGDGAEQGTGVDVVGEQAAGGGEDAGAEVAGGQLAQLAGQHGDAERWQGRPEQGDAVGLQEGADGVQAPRDARRDGLGAHHDHVAALVGQGLELGQHLVQGAPVDVLEHGRGQRPFVLRRQCQVGTGHGDGSWHARLPVSHARRSAGVAPAPRMTSLRDYVSTVSTRL